ncbi:hypothetical protein, partial [Paraburkholderia sediminicola]|uniref:hypothetical protein n=1 Tax=Paraburkholderia sediminicola TaxID=458836 RepID=UPI0038BC6609
CVCVGVGVGVGVGAGVGAGAFGIQQNFETPYAGSVPKAVLLQVTPLVKTLLTLFAVVLAP